MNFKNQVNKINRGFVYLDGTWSRPGFFVPAVAGVRTPEGGVQDPAPPSPRSEGRAGGWEALSPYQGIKKPPTMDTPAEGRGQNRPGGRRPHCGPGIVIIARMFRSVKPHFPPQRGRRKPPGSPPQGTPPGTPTPAQQHPGGGRDTDRTGRRTGPDRQGHHAPRPAARHHPGGEWGGGERCTKY